MSIYNGSAPGPQPTRQPYEYGRVGRAPTWPEIQTPPPVSTGQSFGSGSTSNMTMYPGLIVGGPQQYQSAEPLPQQQAGLGQGQTRSRVGSTSSGSHYTQASLTDQVPDDHRSLNM